MSNISLKPIPFVTSGMAYGGTPEDNVLNYMKMQAEIQTNMNNKYGGSNIKKLHKSRKSRKSHKKIKKNKRYSLKRYSLKRYSLKNKKSFKRKLIRKHNRYYRYKLKGGTDYIEVPQFQNNNLNYSPQNANTNSVLLNKVYMDSLNNSKYDCYATNSCPKDTLKGGRHKTRKINHKYKKSNKYLKGGNIGCNSCGIAGTNNIYLKGGKCNCLNSRVKKLFKF